MTRSRLQLIGTPFCARWALRHAATAIPLPQKSIFDLRVNAMEPLLSSLGFLLIGGDFCLGVPDQVSVAQNGEPHLMVARGTPIDPNSCVASLRKPFDARDFHHFTAAARRAFSRARHQQTLKYRHCLSTVEMLGPPCSLLEGYFTRVSLAWSASFSCFGYFNEVTGVDVIDVAVNRNMLSDERMLTDTAYVLSYA